MSVTPSDLKDIVDHLSLDLVDQKARDALSRVVITLIDIRRPETIDDLISRTVQASAVIGYYESVWRAKERREEVLLDNLRAIQATAFRERQKLLKEKVTEAQVTEALAVDPSVLQATLKLTAITEIADIIEAVRYAVRNHHDGLLEQSRNERKSGGLG